MIGKEKKTETKPETNPSGDHPLCDSTQPSRCRQGLEGGHVGGGGGGGGIGFQCNSTHFYYCEHV